MTNNGVCKTASDSAPAMASRSVRTTPIERPGLQGLDDITFVVVAVGGVLRLGDLHRFGAGDVDELGEHVTADAARSASDLRRERHGIDGLAGPASGVNCTLRPRAQRQ